MSRIAAQVRKQKEKNPSAYCPVCLWRVETRFGRKPCPKHMAQQSDEDFIKARVHEAVAELKPTLVPPPQSYRVRWLAWLGQGGDAA